MYKISERLLTLDDFIQVRKIKPYKKWRSNAKTINFGTIFACSGPALGAQMKSAGFSEEDLDASMDTYKLWPAFNKEVLANKSADKLQIKYNLVGCQIRELFFKIYPCLLERTLREQNHALRYGFVQSWTGPIRHLHELRYMKINSNGEVCGPDKMLYSGMFSHLLNNATNSPIQTAEVYQAMPDVTSINKFRKTMGLKSYVFNFVHDSFECYVYRPERDLFYAFLNEIAQVHRQPFFDIPMHIDVEESDPDKGEVFREGRELNIEHFSLKDELEKWNKKYGTNWTFEQVDPRQWIPRHGNIDGARKVGVQYTPQIAQ